MQEIALTQSEEKRYYELQLIAIDYARYGNSVELEKMLKAGMNVNLCDEKGNSLLMLASYNRNLDTSKLLLEYGAAVDLRNDRGQTPLGGIAFKGDIDILNLLLKYGADVNADQGGGKTPLMFASLFGNKKIVDILIKNGADVDSQTLMGINAHNVVNVTSGIRNVIEKIV